MVGGWSHWGRGNGLEGCRGGDQFLTLLGLQLLDRGLKDLDGGWGVALLDDLLTLLLG